MSDRCTQLSIDCFGVYFFEAGQSDQAGTRFIYNAGEYNGFPAGLLEQLNVFMVDHNPEPTELRPDLEWSINDFNQFRQLAGYQPVDLNAVIPWELNMVGFAGSFQDDGIGEDFLPNNAPFVTVRFPCQAFDACDVCGGDGSSCADCAGAPNGPAAYDECDVCNGSGPDLCGVCGGNNSPDW